MVSRVMCSRDLIS